jgi:hypothetical protein
MMDEVLRRGRKQKGYSRVKIAILDTGIDSQSSYLKHIKGYKDFVEKKEQRIDMTGHGTMGVHLLFKMLNTADIYVARVFEGEKADGNTAKPVEEVRADVSPPRALLISSRQSNMLLKSGRWISSRWP